MPTVPTRPAPPSVLVLRRVRHLVTGTGTELHDVDVLCDAGTIRAIGAALDAPEGADVFDASSWIVTPGLVNSHQHLYQVGLRAIGPLERAPIGPWLGGLGARCLEWEDDGRLTPERIGAIAAAGMAESVLGGVTTIADQHYLHPAGATRRFIEATITAAGELGVRIHATRGTLTMGRDQGAGADPRLVQSVDEVLRHSAQLIDEFHDPDPGAFVRVDLAPCGVHTDPPELFEAFAALASDHAGVRLHTHCYEVVDSGFCRERYGITPWEFLVRHGWAQPRTWLAHMVDVAIEELPHIAAAGVGIAHLVAPDLRMGWGVAPVRAMLDAGVTVGFGTTGSASNDGANLLGDLRVAALVHRMSPSRTDLEPNRWLSARELLHMATRGSAECLGRPELGRIEVGAAADLAAWDLDAVDRVGIDDPVVGLLLCGLSDRATFVAIGGRVVVEAGRLVTAYEARVAAEARAALRP